jgi:integrase
MVARFLEEGAADLSPQTIRRHKQVFKNQLIPYFKKTSIKAIGPRGLVKYIRIRQNGGAAPNTIHKEIAALSAVFNYLAAEELIPPINPTRAIKKPRIRQVRPHYSPSSPELERIFEHLYPGARLFFLALCNTGCRLAEIQSTNVSDVDLDQKLLRVVRKGGNVDYVPINTHLLEEISEDLKSRNARPGDPLFLNNHLKRYKRITRSRRTACRNAEVPHTTHHGLRHAYATLLHEAGNDDGTISRLVGHANPTITRNTYIHWKDPEVRRAAESVAVGKCKKSANSRKILKFEKKEVL